MKKLNYAVLTATLLGFAGFSGSLLAEDAAKKEQKAETSQTEPSGAAGKPAEQPAGEQKQAEQGKPDDKMQAKPGDAAQDKKAESGGVKVQDYSKAGAYKDGKPVAGSTGQTGDRPGGEKGAAGPAAPAGDAAKEDKAGDASKVEDKAGAEKKQ